MQSSAGIDMSQGLLYLFLMMEEKFCGIMYFMRSLSSDIQRMENCICMIL